MSSRKILNRDGTLDLANLEIESASGMAARTAVRQ
jgi:hypothetical protein